MKLLLSFLTIACSVWAQSRADQVVSPEVHSDGRVTFRVYAPKASEVTVAGEWMRPDGHPMNPQKLVKGDDGVWSATLGPIEPNSYIYTFNVDGMTIADPVNPSMKLRARTSASIVTVL